MQPRVTFDRTLVAVMVDEVVHVLLELEAPPALPVERPPLDLVVVLDRSGSMDGNPLEAVTRATAQLLRLAGPDDRIGVVAFGSHVEMVLPLAHHDPVMAAPVVEAIGIEGMTNLSGGWLKAVEMLTEAGRPDALRRIVVLTDGHANVGITDQDRLHGLALQARSHGVGTSCIGFSDGYDEVLLAALADAGGGNDYWCAGADQAAAVFGAEFEGLASVVAQNVSVEVRTTPACEELAVLHEYPITAVAGGMQIALGDAYGGERRRVVAKLWLGPAPEGPVHVCDLVIRWAAVAGDAALHAVTVPVVVHAGGDGTGGDPWADPAVTEEVTRLEIARERRAAQEAADRGDFGDAAARISAARAQAVVLADGDLQHALGASRGVVGFEVVGGSTCGWGHRRDSWCVRPRTHEGEPHRWPCHSLSCPSCSTRFARARESTSCVTRCGG
jgi:Ca-activated chloride channel family protein